MKEIAKEKREEVLYYTGKHFKIERLPYKRKEGG